MTLNLPTKKEIFIRDLTIDFNADRNQNEKRFTIGEHNGQEWVRKPKSIILNQVRESRIDHQRLFAKFPNRSRFADP